MTFTVFPLPADGAEDVVVAPAGPWARSVFTGTADGSIYRLSPDGQRLALVTHTGGRPLGLEMLGEDRLVVCDARLGLLVAEIGTGSVETLVSEVDGAPLRFPNNAAVAADGTIWFSDSSTRFGIEAWKNDFVQDTRTGRLLRRDPDGSVTTVLDGLAFANGVALSAAEDYVAVAETGARTVVRRWLTGERAGMRDLLCQNLPGYPDNIARGSDGLIWVTIASPTDPVVERLKRGPLRLRKAVTALPARLQPAPKRTVRVQAYDDRGALVEDLDLEPAGYHMVTGVREHDGAVWMGSLHEPAIAVFAR